jgi:hypothetical protein
VQSSETLSIGAAVTSVFQREFTQACLYPVKIATLAFVREAIQKFTPSISHNGSGGVGSGQRQVMYMKMAVRETGWNNTSTLKGYGFCESVNL